MIWHCSPANPTMRKNEGRGLSALAAFIIAFTASGPILGGLGFVAFDSPILFWSGVALSVGNLFMNLVSGVMKLPLLPLLCVIVAIVLLQPWYVGAGVGLIAWTAFETATEIFLVWWHARDDRR